MQCFFFFFFFLIVKMAPRMAAVLRAPGKLQFFVCFICFFVVLRVRCCSYNCLR